MRGVSATARVAEPAGSALPTIKKKRTPPIRHRSPGGKPFIPSETLASRRGFSTVPAGFTKPQRQAPRLNGRPHRRKQITAELVEIGLVPHVCTEAVDSHGGIVSTPVEPSVNESMDSPNPGLHGPNFRARNSAAREGPVRR
jgi:hypothetical protein